MKKKFTKAAFIVITAWLSLSFFSMPGSYVNASIQDNDTPDNDPYYDNITISDQGVVLLNDAETSTDGNAEVSYNTDESVITVDYSITKAMKGTIPIPNNVYNSTVTITNNSTQGRELDISKSMKIFLWGYIEHGRNVTYDSYSYYETVLDKWIMFKFNIIRPDGNNISVSPYAAITDYSGSTGYHFPSEDDSHVMLDTTSSLEGDYYAKAMLPVPNIVLNPGESMQIPWNFGMSWYANNGTQDMQMDFNFRLVFNRIAEQTYPYIVKYYQDAVDVSKLLGSKSGVTTFVADYQLTQSDVATDFGDDWLNVYRPNGYDNGKVEDYPIISVDETNNVVNVVYTKTPVPPVEPNDSQEVPEVESPSIERKDSMSPQTGQQDSLTKYIILLLGSFFLILWVWKNKEVKL